MNTQKRFLISVVLILAVGQLALATALDDYVAKPDASYKYEIVKTIDGPAYTGYVVDMTSQTWRTKDEVDRPQWRHWVRIVKPKEVTTDIAMLYINGGSNRGDAPDSVDMLLGMIAMGTKSIVSEIKMVPNQPLNFPDGGRPRSEDAIIAYTFDKFIQTGDSTWPVLLPMVKSAVRAMDTVQSIMKGLEKDPVEIKRFVVGGGSKRGWTTWLTAAVDKRVTAICPAVIDVLNMAPQMRHHHGAYGFWAPAIQDYEEMKVFDRLDTPGGTKLRGFIDPYSYRDRYKMPKFLLNSSGDQFFLPDSAQFYFADLPGEKYLQYFPNTGHGLDMSAFSSVTTLYKSVLAGAERPKFTWKVREGNGAITVTAKTKPMEVRLWQATNPDKRDFRVDTFGPHWTSTILAPKGKSRYVAKVDKPEKGWTAYFVELAFNGGEIGQYKFTTEIRVVPDTLPFEQK